MIVKVKCWVGGRKKIYPKIHFFRIFQNRVPQTTNARKWLGEVCVLISVSFRNAACNIVHMSILNRYISEMHCI